MESLLRRLSSLLANHIRKSREREKRPKKARQQTMAAFDRMIIRISLTISNFAQFSSHDLTTVIHIYSYHIASFHSPFPNHDMRFVFASCCADSCRVLLQLHLWR
jgi:hypothetical protein